MRNILAQAATLLASPLAEDEFMCRSQLKYSADGERVYDELNTGEWWQETENMATMREVTKFFHTKPVFDLYFWPGRILVANHFVFGWHLAVKKRFT